MMPKLKLRERWLYRRKNYDKLAKLMRRSQEGADRFIELCCQDDCLQVWLIGSTIAGMSAMMEKGHRHKAALKETFESHGLGKFYTLHESIQEKSAVTIEQVAAAFGLSAEDMRTMIAANPALLKVWPIIEQKEGR